MDDELALFQREMLKLTAAAPPAPPPATAAAAAASVSTAASVSAPATRKPMVPAAVGLAWPCRAPPGGPGRASNPVLLACQATVGSAPVKYTAPDPAHHVQPAAPAPQAVAPDLRTIPNADLGHLPPVPAPIASFRPEVQPPKGVP
jgi:hypothetical protein